jgi:hypothetical protein
MTNFIEELDSGDCFNSSGELFIITADYKKDGSRLCISLKNGFSKWFKSDIIVNKTSIFYTDNDSNIIAIKELSKDDVNA